jgi:hypothetical protein
MKKHPMATARQFRNDFMALVSPAGSAVATRTGSDIISLRSKGNLSL